MTRSIAVLSFSPTLWVLIGHFRRAEAAPLEPPAPIELDPAFSPLEAASAELAEAECRLFDHRESERALAHELETLRERGQELLVRGQVADAIACEPRIHELEVSIEAGDAAARPLMAAVARAQQAVAAIQWRQHQLAIEAGWEQVQKPPLI